MAEPQPLLHGITFDLEVIAREMRSEGVYDREGHTARTLAREADFRVVLVVMKAGALIKEHGAAETASVYALSGRLRLRLVDRVAELPCGQLLVLARNEQHNVEALEESTFLLTLGWHAKP